MSNIESILDSRTTNPLRPMRPHTRRRSPLSSEVDSDLSPETLAAISRKDFSSRTINSSGGGGGVVRQNGYLPRNDLNMASHPRGLPPPVLNSPPTTSPNKSSESYRINQLSCLVVSASLDKNPRNSPINNHHLNHNLDRVPGDRTSFLLEKDITIRTNTFSDPTKLNICLNNNNNKSNNIDQNYSCNSQRRHNSFTQSSNEDATEDVNLWEKVSRRATPDINKDSNGMNMRFEDGLDRVTERGREILGSKPFEVQQPQQVIRVALFGFQGVGKSSLILQFIRHRFRTQYLPTIEDTYQKELETSRGQRTLRVTDTNGSFQFAAMQRRTISHSHVILLVFSITCRHSFDFLGRIYQEVRRCPESKLIILVGTKCDQHVSRQVTQSHALSQANSWNCPYVETSAKDNVNIQELFTGAAKLYLESIGGSIKNNGINNANINSTYQNSWDSRRRDRLKHPNQTDTKASCCQICCIS